MALPVVLTMATQNGWVFVVTIGFVLIANPIVRCLRKNRFFASEQFQSLKAEITSVVGEHNDVVNYVGEIRLSPTANHTAIMS